MLLYSGHVLEMLSFYVEIERIWKYGQNKSFRYLEDLDFDVKCMNFGWMVYEIFLGEVGTWKFLVSGTGFNGLF